MLWKVVVIVLVALLAAAVTAGIILAVSGPQQEVNVRTVLPGECIKALDEAEEFVVEGPVEPKDERKEMLEEYQHAYQDCMDANG